MHVLTKLGVMVLVAGVILWVGITLAIPLVGPNHLSRLAPLAIAIVLVGTGGWGFVITGAFLSHRTTVLRAEKEEFGEPTA
jgi:hypothetical protein